MGSSRAYAVRHGHPTDPSRGPLRGRRADFPGRLRPGGRVSGAGGERHRIPLCQGHPADHDRGQAHRGDRPAGVRAVGRRRQARERRGLRGRRRVRRRREARLRAGRRGVDPGPLQQRHRARPEGVRLRHQPVLHHRRAQAGRRLLLAVLPGAADGHRAEDLAGGERDRRVGAGLGASSARRSAPPASRRSTTSIKPTTQAAVYNTNEDAKKALQNGTDRRARRRPAHGVLHHRRRGARRPRSSASCPRSARPRRSGSCSTRARR